MSRANTVTHVETARIALELYLVGATCKDSIRVRIKVRIKVRVRVRVWAQGGVKRVGNRCIRKSPVVI